jgi:pathogenesis-related protein 1
LTLDAIRIACETTAVLSGKMIWVLWVVALGIVNQANSQTIELRSVELSVLKGAERERFLAAHNVARKEVGVDPVQWSDELSNMALKSLAQQKEALIDQAKTEWSKERAVIPKHRPDSNVGENVAGWVGKRSTSAELAIAFWLKEKAAFDRLNSTEPYRVGDEKDKVEIDAKGGERPIVVGHYTAIVWRTTRFIGAAKLSFVLVDDEGHLRNYAAIVCNYSPVGNRLGEAPY